MIRNSIQAVFLCGLLFGLPCQAVQDKTFFWEVSSDTTSVYILGSIHFADDGFYPLRRIITDSFDASDNLVVEVDVSRIEPAAYNDSIKKYGSYDAGEDVSHHLSGASYQRLQQVLDELSIPIQAVVHKKPAFIVLDLTAALLARLGYRASEGIDVAFIRRALATGKNIVALESLQQQFRMFSKLPYGETMLIETLDEIEHVEKELSVLIDAWKRGDEKQLIDVMIDEPEQNYEGYKHINQILLFDRNNAMVEKIRLYLQSDETWFVVVGAGHLIGDSGIINQLSEAGFRLERL